MPAPQGRRCRQQRASSTRCLYAPAAAARGACVAASFRMPMAASLTGDKAQARLPVEASGAAAALNTTLFFYVSSVMKFSAIDWNQAPANARWWAMDGDGHAYWYCTPQIASATTFWFAARHPAPSFGYARDFRLSLQERPAAADDAPALAAAARMLRR